MRRIWKAFLAGSILATAAINISEAGAEVATKTVKLPKPTKDGKITLEKAIGLRRSVRSFADKPLSLAQASQLLWSAQGITDSANGLRAAPSAGACYPIALYLVAGRVEGLEPGIYLYSPSGHLLLKKAGGDTREKLGRAALNQASVRKAPAVLALAADYGRIKPRYQERSTRYTDMEAGHIGQNVSLQAVSLGLGTVMVGAFDDSGVKGALGLPDGEIPLYLIPVGVPAN